MIRLKTISIRNVYSPSDDGGLASRFDHRYFSLLIEARSIADDSWKIIYITDEVMLFRCMHALTSLTQP